MAKVIVNDKEYIVIKEYEHFTLCKDEQGLRICFDDFDLGLIERKPIERQANNKWG